MEEVFTFKKLYRAYLDCRESKRSSESAVEFEIEMEENLFRLLQELKERIYMPGKSICFVVRDPKPREVFAAGFRDRIVHHLLVNEIQPAGERIFIHDSYACREGKGTHRAVERLRDFIKKGRGQGKELYYLQLDIDGFFMNINKDALIGILQKLVFRQNRADSWKNDVFWLAKTIIEHDPTKDYQLNSPAEFFRLIPDRKSLFKQPAGKGLPIGNYTSQFFANLYMNELDQYVKRTLKCRFYIRYVDDFILMHNDQRVLKSWLKEIRRFVFEYIDIKISERKIRCQNTAKGIDFLGYFIKPDYVLARRAVVARFRKKLLLSEKAGIESDKKFKAMVRSYFGHFYHANCQSLVRKHEFYLK